MTVAALVAELDGVGEQVDQDLAAGALVGDERGRIARRICDRQRTFLSRARRVDHLRCTARPGASGAKRLGLQFELAGLDPAHVQQHPHDVDAGDGRSGGSARHIPLCFGDSSPTMPVVIISEKPTMALSGVRSSWPMVARNRDLALEASSAARRASRISVSLSLALGDVAQQRHDFEAARREAVVDAPATGNFDPDELRHAAGALGIVLAHANFHHARLAVDIGIGKGGQIGGPVEHVDALEQPAAGQFVALAAEELFGRARGEQHLAIRRKRITASCTCSIRCL